MQTVDRIKKNLEHSFSHHLVYKMEYYQALERGIQPVYDWSDGFRYVVTAKDTRVGGTSMFSKEPDIESLPPIAAIS